MSDRFLNQKGIINADKLGQTRFVVVGAGAIGTAFTIALCKMGAKIVTVYDYDTIENHNFANQMHPISQLGKAKVDSLMVACKDYGDCTITTVNAPWTTGNAVDADIVVSCVDNMDVRSALWRHYQDKVDFFIDGRMSAFVYKVYGMALKDASASTSRQYYGSTLHSQASASPEPCGEKSIIYTVYLVAGMMLSQVREWLTDEAKPYRATEVIYDSLNHTIKKVCHQEPVQMNVIEEDNNENANTEAANLSVA